MPSLVPKTRSQEAYDLLMLLEQEKGRPGFNFQRKRFQKSYQNIDRFESDWLYFYETIDEAMDGNIQAIKNYVKNIDISILSIDLAINSINLCFNTGLFYQASLLMRNFKFDYERINYIGVLTTIYSVLGFIDQAKEMIFEVNKRYPEESKRIFIPHQLVAIIEEKGIKSDDLTLYWKQFEDLIILKAAKVKIFSRSVHLSTLVIGDEPTLSIEFVDCKELSEDEMFQISDDIADGLASIEGPVELLSFITADIAYQPLLEV